MLEWGLRLGLQSTGSGGGGIPEIGGVPIGAAGDVGTPYEGFTLSAGDDFDSTPSRWSGQNLTGRYAHSALSYGFRRTSLTDSGMYIDPAFRGARSSSPSNLGYDGVSIASSVATFTASVPPSELLPYLPTDFGAYGDAEGRPKIITGTLKTGPSFLLSAKADYIIDCKVKFAAGIARGYWPSFWTTTFFWPDGQEFDAIEISKNTGTGVITNRMNLNGSTTDGGANVTVALGTVSPVPTNRFIQVVGKKYGTTLEVWDDIAVEGTLALRCTYTNARVSRFKGVHDIRLDLAINNGWDSSTYNAADWPKIVEFDWWRAWVPSTADYENPATVVLPAINTTPGGSWAGTLPATSTLSGGKAGLEEIFGAYDNLDAPGMPTRNTTTKLPTSMTVNAGTRAITGTVPTTEGGRMCVAMTYAFDDGSPAARALLPYNVAPAAQGSLFGNQNLEYGVAVDLDVNFVDFHSGNLGPHTYNVTKTGGSWLTITGNGTGSVNIAGTTPGSDDSVTLTVQCTNSIGQTTTVNRTITVAAAAAWSPADWSGLSAWYDASDNATVFSDTAGTTQSVAGSTGAKRINDKTSNGHHMTESTVNPTYITDGLNSMKALKFTGASNQRLFVDDSLANVASGNDNGYTVVMAIRRGAPGVSTTPFSFSSTSTNNYNRHPVSGGNAVGISKTISGVATNALSSAVVASDQWYVVTVVYSGTAVNAWVNGAQVATNVALDTAATTLNRTILGALWDFGTTAWTLGFDGAIGEVLIADETTKSASAIEAEAYLSAKWL